MFARSSSISTSVLYTRVDPPGMKVLNAPVRTPLMSSLYQGMSGAAVTVEPVLVNRCENFGTYFWRSAPFWSSRVHRTAFPFEFHRTETTLSPWWSGSTLIMVFILVTSSRSSGRSPSLSPSGSIRTMRRDAWWALAGLVGTFFVLAGLFCVGCDAVPVVARLGLAAAWVAYVTGCWGCTSLASTRPNPSVSALASCDTVPCSCLTAFSVFRAISVVSRISRLCRDSGSLLITDSSSSAHRAPFHVASIFGSVRSVMSASSVIASWNSDLPPASHSSHWPWLCMDDRSSLDSWPLVMLPSSSPLASTISASLTCASNGAAWFGRAGCDS